jgi:subtilisin family serine protease
MRSSRITPLVALVALAGCESATDLTEASDLGPQAAAVASWEGPLPYLVIANGRLPGNLASAIERHGGEVSFTVPAIGVAAVTSANPDFIADMSNVRGIASVMPDLLVELPDGTAGEDLHTHDPIPYTGGTDLGDLLWGLDAVSAPGAWAAGYRGAGVRVAVLDAGIDDTHPDLAPNVNSELSVSFTPCIFGLNCDGSVENWRISPGFYFNHGTHTSGTIAAVDNGNGVTGVAPEAEIVAVKVCTEFVNACFTSGILAGLVYAGDIDADLVNMSLGGIRRLRNDFVKQCKEAGNPAPFCASLAKANAQFQDDYVAQVITVYRRAFDYAFQAGTTVIVSAGNSALNFDQTKDIWAAFADFPHTIGVSALGPVGWCLDPSGADVNQLAYYSSYGQSIVDVSAPGGNFGGALLGGQYLEPCTVAGVTRPVFAFDGVMSTISEGWGWAQGTSMAAPHAVGVAAIIIGANGGDMSPPAVENALKRLATDLGSPGHDAVYGAGRVGTGY